MTLPSPAERARGQVSLALLVFLALMTSVVALTIDALLPALDAIAADLRFAHPNDRQLLVLLVFLGMGLSQPVWGALADGIGRRPTALVGWTIFALGTLMGALATSPGWMFAGRFLQGIGAGAPRLVAMAIARDLYEGRPMARVLSLVMTVFMLVPMLAPLVGQAMEALAGWRAIFALYLAMALVAAGWYLADVPETLDPARRRPLTPRPLLAAFAEVLTTRSSMLYTLAATAVFGAFTVYLATAQQVLEEAYALGLLFPLAFGGLALVFAVASLTNSRLVMRLGMRRLTLGAIGTMLAVALAGVALSMAAGGLPPLGAFLLLTGGIFLAVAVLFANLTALALTPLGHLSGTASSVINSCSILGAVPLGYVIAQGYDGTVTPLFAGFLGLGLLALLAVLAAEPARPAMAGEG